MECRAELERVLTEHLRKEEAGMCVTVSFDGQFAIYKAKDRYKLRKLSKVAREFLHKGGDIRAVENCLFE
jgi:hypothetical protein